MTDPNELRDKIAQEAAEDIGSKSLIMRHGYGYHDEDNKALDIIAAAKIITAALDQYAEGLRVKMLREAAKEICPGCRDESLLEKHRGDWWHPVGSVGCRARVIHDLIAATQVEDPA